MKIKLPNEKKSFINRIENAFITHSVIENFKSDYRKFFEEIYNSKSCHIHSLIFQNVS